MIPSWFYLSRIHLARIEKIDMDTGTVSINLLDGLPAGRDDVPQSFSVSVQGFNSAWMRFAPQVRDLVYVGFSTKNEPRVLGVAMPETVYEQVSKAATNHPNAFPAGDFLQLKPGEWDLRSSGGAYVHGGQNGSLLLSGGPTSQLRFRKRENDARGQSGLWDLATLGSSVRLGDVKRTVPPTLYTETDVSLLDPTAPQEFAVHVGSAAGLVVASEQLGAVRDSLGVPELSVRGPALRQRTRVYVPGSVVESTATTLAERSIDVTGTIRDSSVIHVISAPLIQLGSDVSVQPVPLGIPLSVAAVTFATELAAQMTALAAGLTAASAAASSNPATQGMAAGLTAGAAAATLAATTATALAGAMAVPGPVFSTKTFTE